MMARPDRKSTRLNSSHGYISYAVFCLKNTATTRLYTLSLHDALPISAEDHSPSSVAAAQAQPAAEALAFDSTETEGPSQSSASVADDLASLDTDSLDSASIDDGETRSEEHTSELQSRLHLVCRLLLEKYRHHPPLHSFPTRRSSDLRRRSFAELCRRGASAARSRSAGVRLDRDRRPFAVKRFGRR